MYQRNVFSKQVSKLFIPNRLLNFLSFGHFKYLCFICIQSRDINPNARTNSEMLKNHHFFRISDGCRFWWRQLLLNGTTWRFELRCGFDIFKINCKRSGDSSKYWRKRMKWPGQNPFIFHSIIFEEKRLQIKSVLSN